MAAGLAFSTNWLALIPWRRQRDKHWSEQARLLYPVFVAARSNLWVIPAILALAVVLWLPDSSPLWVFTGLAALLGAQLGTMRLNREVFPRISIRDLGRLALLGVLTKSLIWVVFIGATVAMPSQFNLTAWILSLGVAGVWGLWSHGGFIWLGRRVGLIGPAPERLVTIATEVSARMNIPFREVLLMRSPVAQALAMPNSRKIIFAERVSEIAPDEEIAAICAHELAHLTESKTARYSRSVAMFMFLPWIWFNPLTQAFGMLAFAGMLGFTLVVPRLYVKLSRRLETRADELATTHELDAGTYARALARLYEDSYLPAVVASKRITHPHLYDRMLAAGVTPDFPRPAAAPVMAWHGRIAAGLVGGLFAIFVMRSLNVFNH